MDSYILNWKTKHSDLTPLLQRYYKTAYLEIQFPTPIPIIHDYAIYPKSFYSRFEIQDLDKPIDFCFLGQRNYHPYQLISRKWVDEFVMTHFTSSSYLQYNGETSDYISKGVFDYTNIVHGTIPRILTDDCLKYDDHYVEIMKKSKFCLCPAGNYPWSMRFYEALICKSIPIVKEPFETWRSHAEQQLDYKFYYADDTEFIYREDWAQHNYDIFLRYHTLEYK
jgi:Exostosin family